MLKKKIGLILAFWLAFFSLNGCSSEEYFEYDSLSLITGSSESLAEEVGENSFDIDSAETDGTLEPPDAAQVLLQADEDKSEQTKESDPDQIRISKDGEYYSKEEVALYLSVYGELPSNYITKKQASELGWEGGSLEPYAPGKAIGGDYFGNYEGKLPKKKGRENHECDIGTKGAKKRGSKRIVYSNDGLIYYTEDHYETFELLYGEE